MLAGNSTPKKIPTATLLVCSCPLEGAVGCRDVTLSLAQSLPCLTETCHCRAGLTHCMGRGSGRRQRVVGTTEEWRSLPPLMERTPFPAPSVRAVGLGYLSPPLNFDPTGQIQQSLRETQESQS